MMNKLLVLLFYSTLISLSINGCGLNPLNHPNIQNTTIPQDIRETATLSITLSATISPTTQLVIKTTQPTSDQKDAVSNGMLLSTPTSIATAPSRSPENENEMVIYVQDYLNSSTYFYFEPKQTSNQYENQFEIYILGYPGPSSPGSASLRFANFDNKIAYVDRQNKVWISDLLNRNPIQIYSYPTDKKVIVYLTWTPDDRHLILDAADSGLPNMIYHVVNNQLEEWNYTCDQLALSPRNKELATWCRASNNPSRFAVLEWNGDIWYSDRPPNSVFLTSTSPDRQEDFRFRLFSLYRNVGWSPDGQEIAYFDTKNRSGSLWIIDRVGNVKRQMPQKAYWSSEANQKEISLPGIPIQWSKNRTRLLILAAGTPQKPCPKLGPEFLASDANVDRGCWQVVDSTTGELIWSAGDVKTKEMVNASHKDGEAAISPDGQFIALFSYIRGPDPRCFVIELSTGRIYSTPFTVEVMRWGPKL